MPGPSKQGGLATLGRGGGLAGERRRLLGGRKVAVPPGVGRGRGTRESQRPVGGSCCGPVDSRWQVAGRRQSACLP